MKMHLILFGLIILLNAVSADVDCAGMAEVCAADCNDECDLTKWEYCRKYDYSGCALDVFCYCNICNIYDQKWCQQYSDFRACAEGVKATYISCIQSCQSKREAKQDVSTCWIDCNKVMDEAIIECKQAPCDDFCKEEGYPEGRWAKFTHEYGWDSCLCDGEKKSYPKETIFKSPFADGEDSDGDGWADRFDECPNEKGHLRGCPDKDYDGIPDKDDACPDQHGPAEYQGCEPGALVKIKDGISWLFTKQGPGQTGSSGRIHAIKNKKGIQVFRYSKQKWYPIGLNSPLYPGDMLKIGPDSRVQLEMWLPKGERNLVELRPNTLYETGYISPDQQYAGQRPISVILKGAAKVIYNRVSGNHEPVYHKTPTVCVGVRGTEFIIMYDNETYTDTIMLLKGEIELTAEENITLTEGQKITVIEGQFQDIEELSAEDKEKFLETEWDQEYRGLPAVAIAVFIVAVIVLKKMHKR